jgi:feruloyl-CoA synthase
MNRLRLSVATVDCEKRPDGSFILTNREPLDSYANNIANHLITWAQREPERIALADRKSDPRAWRTMTYDALARRSAEIAALLESLRLGPDRPVMLISENRIESALIQMACFRAGVPIAPVTPAYSSGQGDPSRLEVILKTLRPGLIVIDQPGKHLNAFQRIGWSDSHFVGIEPHADTQSFESFKVEDSAAALPYREKLVGADEVAKILFTSGSTGTPKGALTTHRMLASNVQAIRQGWPFLDFEPAIISDWLPWNHTFGGNFVLNMVIGSGGTLYIDDGKPLANAIRRSVENNAEIKPNLLINTPRGLEMFARVLAEDEALAAPLFERLGLIFFASAGLSSRVRNSWYALIKKHATREVQFVSAWGTTETAPLATALNFDAPEINNIGTPVPGTTIKLAALGDRYELRVKGPNISPGYMLLPAETRAMFDEEGYFRSGDVGRLSNPENPSAGLLIEGRLAEDFKLNSGTWVNVSGLRAQILELLGPIVRDIVISGAHRQNLAALIFLDQEQCERFLGIKADCSVLAVHPRLAGHVQATLQDHNSRNPGSSRRIRNFRIMPRLLDATAGEVTEKGTVNQAAVLRRETAICDELDSDLEDAVS